MRDTSIDKTGETIDISFHILLSEFDDVIGPNIITVSPPLPELFKSYIKKIVPHLLDIDVSEIKYEPFMYSNTYFLSHNIAFTLPRLDGRAGEAEYLLTLLITPADPRGLLALANMREFLPTLRESCINSLLKYHQDKNLNKVKENIYENFLQFHDDVNIFLTGQLASFGEGLIRISDFNKESSK